MISTVYNRLLQIAQQQFPEIVVGSKIFFSAAGRARKLRIYLFDDSFVDIWISIDAKYYSYQWVIPDQTEFVYRHDNAPHARWESVSSFPKHCHFRSHENVVESNIPDTPSDAIVYLLDRVTDLLRQR